MSKPLLLLDVDGVLVVRHDMGPSFVPIGYTDTQWFSTDLIQPVQELDLLFEIVWCTGWEHHANEILAPIFKITPKEVIKMDFRAFVKKGYAQHAKSLGFDDDDVDIDDAIDILSSQNWKLDIVQEWLLTQDDPNRPLAWVDDLLDTADVIEWAENRPNTLLICTPGNVGLRLGDVNRLKGFVESL